MAYPERRIRFRILRAGTLRAPIAWARTAAAAGAGLLLGALVMAGGTPSEGEGLAVGAGVGVAAPVASPARPLTRAEWLGPILERNVFDASKAGQAWDEKEGDDVDLSWLLLGTIVAEPEAYSSAAIVAEDSGARPRFYGLGDALDEEVVLVGIETDHVVLRLGDGTLADLHLAEGGVRREDEAPEVRKTGSDQWEVNDAALALLYDAEHPLKGVRTEAHRPRRGRSGVRLARVGRRTAVYRLGLRRGDIVYSLHDQRTEVRKDLVAALRTLKTPSEFTVEVTRGKRARTLRFEVR